MVLYYIQLIKPQRMLDLGMKQIFVTGWHQSASHSMCVPVCVCLHASVV